MQKFEDRSQCRDYLYILSFILFSFLETIDPMAIYIEESSSLGTPGDTVRRQLGILVTANRDPVLHDFGHGFQH